MIWGDQDHVLGVELSEPEPADVPGLERVVHLPASHWVHHDEPDQVTALLVDFFRAD